MVELIKRPLDGENLTRSWRANQEHSLGNPSTNGGEPLWPLEKIHHFHELVLGLVHTGNIIKHHSGFGLHLELGFGLSKQERIVGASLTQNLSPPREEEEAARQQQ